MFVAKGYNREVQPFKSKRQVDADHAAGVMDLWRWEGIRDLYILLIPSDMTASSVSAHLPPSLNTAYVNHGSRQDGYRLSQPSFSSLFNIGLVHFRRAKLATLFKLAVFRICIIGLWTRLSGDNRTTTQ